MPQHHDDDRGQCDQREERAERAAPVELRLHHAPAQHADLQAHPPAEPRRLVRMVPVRLAKILTCVLLKAPYFVNN